MSENHPLPRNKGHKIFRKLLFVATAAFCYCVIFFLVQTTFPFASAVKCDLTLQQEGQVQLYYSNGYNRRGFTEKSSRKSGLVKAGTRQIVKLNLPNASLNGLRIDPGNGEGLIKLYGLEIYSPITGSVKLDPEQIAKTFEPGHQNVSLHLKDNYLAIEADGPDPFIISRSPLLGLPYVVQYSLPALFSFLIVLGLSRLQLSDLKSLLVSKKNPPGSGQNIYALDGLRGLATLLVVGDHCYGKFLGLGATGVWIFLVLSGFLLSRPFISNPGWILSPEKMLNFYLNRCRRILPIYYSYIVVVYLLTAQFDIAVRHFLFLEGAGHLWVIPQQVVFYLLGPLVLLISCVGLRGRLKPGLLFILLTTILINKLLTKEVFSMYGVANEEIRLYFGLFLSGVVAAYFEQIISTWPQSYKQKIGRFSSFCGLFLLGFLLLASSEVPWGGTILYAQNYASWYGGLIGWLVLCIVLANGSFLQKMLGWKPLCSLGVVSLSFYLVHPLVIAVVLRGTNHFLGFYLLGIPLLLVTIVIGYLISCLLYTYIELPFLKKASSKAS